MLIIVKTDTGVETVMSCVVAPDDFDAKTEREKWFDWLYEEYQQKECEYISLANWFVNAGCRYPEPSELIEVWDE